MDLMPRSYQIIRQYPQLSRHANLSLDNEADREEEEESEGEDSTEALPLSVTADNKTPFVRAGFGRVSTVSGASVGGAGENFNSVDEITIYGNIRKRCPAR